MAFATARHILVDTEDECNALKTEIENGISSIPLHKGIYIAKVKTQSHSKIQKIRIN